MRVLLDESVPRKLASELAGHDVSTVPQLGWSGAKNGVLLRQAAERGFEALITADQNLEFQQNPSALRLGVVIPVARSNRLVDLKALVPRILQELERLRPGMLVRVS